MSQVISQKEILQNVVIENCFQKVIEVIRNGTVPEMNEGFSVGFKTSWREVNKFSFRVFLSLGSTTLESKRALTYFNSDPQQCPEPNKVFTKGSSEFPFLVGEIR